MSEKRLIDANALLEELDLYAACGVNGETMPSDRVRAVIERADTVDAVAVVRCRDCKHAEPIPTNKHKVFYSDRVLVCKNLRGDYDITHNISVTWKDGYCDEGERKEAADGRTD